MFINLPTITELRNLQFASSALLGVAGVGWGVSYVIAKGLDWLADRDTRRIKGQIDTQAEQRRHLQRVMASRETSR